jgi:serine/threonine protein kinase
VTDVLLAGATLHGGDYTIRRVLARSVFAVTYEARDEKLRRDVAIKEYFPSGCQRDPSSYRVLPTGLVSPSSFEDGRARFLEEARALAPFHHPHIVAVYTFFEENNTVYMVMEYLQGQTLLQVLEERKQLPEREVLRIASQLCAALEAVHEANRLHRDLKPENVMLSGERIVLLDFGLSTRFAADNYSTRQLDEALRFGTPGYAPLEQYTHSGAVSAATDLYALGATLYHLLTGQAPPPATDRAFGTRLEAPQHLNPRISSIASDAILWALRMKPESRPASVRDFARRLFGYDNIQSARAELLALLEWRSKNLQHRLARQSSSWAHLGHTRSTPPPNPTRTMTGTAPVSKTTAPLPPEEDSGCFQVAFILYFILWGLGALLCIAVFLVRVLLFGW